MEDGLFVGQFDLPLLDSAREDFERIIRNALGMYFWKITWEGRDFDIETRCLEHVNRTWDGGILKGIAHIRGCLVYQSGFSTYDYFKYIEEKFPGSLSAHVDKTMYSVWFCTDSMYKGYRCRKWMPFEGKNHYMYAQEVNLMKGDIHSYIVNVLAAKGR